jgi:hypothetical protein
MPPGYLWPNGKAICKQVGVFLGNASPDWQDSARNAELRTQ